VASSRDDGVARDKEVIEHIRFRRHGGQGTKVSEEQEPLLLKRGMR